MKNFSKILALLLVCIMLLPMAIACKNDEEAENESSADTVQTGEINKPIFEMTGLEERDISGEVYVIRYSRLSEWAPKPIDVSKLDAAKDTVSKAGYDRDREFEELTGAELSYQGFDTQPNDFYGSNSEYATIQILIQGGVISDYDLLMVSTSCSGLLIAEQALTDLSEYDNLIHHDKPSYNSVINEQASIGGKQFIVTGYYTTGNIRGALCTRVHNGLLTAQHQDDDKVDELYQLALDHKFTLEALLCYDKGFATGADVEASGTDNGTYVFTMDEYGGQGLFWTLGGTVAEKDNQGIPYVSVDDRVNIDLLSYIRDKVTNNPIAQIAPESGGEKVFEEKRSMFLFGGLLGYNSNDNIDDRLLPAPLYNEGDEYRSLCGAWTTNVAGIPAACADPELAAYCTEIYMALSYQHIYPEFYEKTFALKYVQNHVESQIFDLICDSMSIDIVPQFGWVDSSDTTIRDVITSEADTVGSTVSTYAATIDANIQKFLNDYEF